MQCNFYPWFLPWRIELSEGTSMGTLIVLKFNVTFSFLFIEFLVNSIQVSEMSLLPDCRIPKKWKEKKK